MVKQITCPTKLFHPQAKAPEHKLEKAVGYDISCVGGLDGLPMSAEKQFGPDQMFAWTKMEQLGYVEIFPGEGFLFRTGFAQAIEPGHACLLWDRSGMGAMKLVTKLAGVIDENYRGEWFVRLMNLSRKIVRINVGDPIVQGVYQERLEAQFPLVDELDETKRGAAGFGSTDKPAE